MILNEADKDLLKRARRQFGGFHYATDWYFRGFVPLGYQYAIHQARQRNITVLAGIASGKTTIETASIGIDCLSTPFFKALSTSVTAKQAELGFDMFMSWTDANPHIEHLILDIKMRPWPIVTFQNFSEWEFRTSGLNGRFIRGHEYDRVLYDEAGLDGTGETVKVLRGRLRGRRPDHSVRMARMDIITSPTDAPWLRERYDLGDLKNPDADLMKYLSFRIRTRDNTMLTQDQIALMEVEYTEEMKAVEMDAEFPDYGMSMFPKRHLSVCTDQNMNDIIYIALNPEDLSKPRPGYAWEEHPRYGVTKFQMPYDPDGLYVMAGDPGIDDPPKRNAGAVGVLRVDTKPHQLVYFDWVFGRGSYMPFLASYKYAIEYYNPSIKMLDTTSTQKGIQELGFEQVGIETDKMNFAQDKDVALNALSLDVTNQRVRWPSVAGITKQMGIYTREYDRKGGAQDLVMLLAMLSHAGRFAPEIEKESTGGIVRTPHHNRKQRTKTNIRKRR